MRGLLSVPRGIAEDEALKLALSEVSIAKFVNGDPKKVIFVPGRLLSIVA
jgi:leucyl-tRNA synthetase